MAANDRGAGEVISDQLRSNFSDILTVEEAAGLLRVNPKTLYAHIQSEHPSWALRLGRVIRINRSALLEAFRGNRTVSRLESKP